MRNAFVKGLFVISLISITLRLAYWQIVKADELKVKAEKQHFKNVKVGAKRGDIFFADGSSLAISKPTFNMYALPKTMNFEQKKILATKVAKILSSEKNDEEISDELLEKLSQDLFWVQLKKNIDYKIKEEIENLNLNGIGFDISSSRYYPESSSAAHLLGFVGLNQKSEPTGYFGIEGYYDGELKGVEGMIKHEKDALGLPILIGRFLTSQAQDGKNLILNIDRTVQYIVEQKIKEGMNKYGAKASSAIVMDPKTGNILALATYPNYEPAKYFDYPKEVYKNPLVADSYEPGSTFKVLTMAAAINENKVKADTVCDICDKPIEMGDFTIRTWNNKYYPNTTMIEGIVHSDNTAMVFVSKKLGLDKMYEYINNFGFGEVTNIDVQDESSPDLREKVRWREIDLATASFGQGIAVTSIQMVRAISAIANGGYLMEPHLVKQITSPNGDYEIKSKIVRQVISENTAKVITEMMVKAVDEGEAKFAKPKGFKIAGKTGTAQIPVEGHYDPDKTIASFVGFAPADNPKFVMLVRYDQPSSSPYGSETAAPTFFEIAKELFTYYRIAPEE